MIAMSLVHLKNRKRANNLMLEMGLKEAIDLLSMASSVHW